jgi:hypothetical protein
MRYFLLLAVVAVVGLLSDDPLMSTLGLVSMGLVFLGCIGIVGGGMLFGLLDAMRQRATSARR